MNTRSIKVSFGKGTKQVLVEWPAEYVTCKEDVIEYANLAGWGFGPDDPRATQGQKLFGTGLCGEINRRLDLKARQACQLDRLNEGRLSKSDIHNRVMQWVYTSTAGSEYRQQIMGAGNNVGKLCENLYENVEVKVQADWYVVHNQTEIEPDHLIALLAEREDRENEHLGGELQTTNNHGLGNVVP